MGAEPRDEWDDVAETARIATFDFLAPALVEAPPGLTAAVLSGAVAGVCMAWMALRVPGTPASDIAETIASSVHDFCLQAEAREATKQ